MQYAAYVPACRCTPTAHHQQTPRESRYRLTDLGLIVWHATRRFYNNFDPPPPDLEVVPTHEAQFADRHSRERRNLVKQKYARAMQKAFRQMQEAPPQ